jgi:predicted transcriptional regulator
MTRPPNITATELEVLKVLWDQGPGTVREINERLRTRKRKRAYTTVLTLLQRLQEKGFVTSDKRQPAHVFHAAVTQKELLDRKLTELQDTLCDGAMTPIMQALVEGGRLSKKEAARLRKLLDELEGRRG